MHSKGILFILLFISTFLSAQVENSKALLVKNKVKSELKTLCNGGCTGQLSGFDRRGNLIDYNFFRAGTLYHYIYDEDDKQKMILWIDKSDTTKIDTIYPGEWEAQNITYKKIYDKTSFQDGRIIVKRWGNERFEISLNENKQVTSQLEYINDTLIAATIKTYDEKHRLTKEISKNEKTLKRHNEFKNTPGKLNAFITKIKYNQTGQIIEKFTYFSDPCMGIDNHFLYRFHYHKNGLLESAAAYENGKAFAFSLEYEYEFYK